MAKRGKKYLEAVKQVDRTRPYSPEEAVDLVKKTSTSNFDATVETHIRMNLDPRQADQQVRGVVSLPHGTGKEVRIVAFVEGEAAKIAKEAGADYVADDDLISKIEEGWLEFDTTIAVPQMMGKVSKLGRVLGPRGMMPSPKTGTVVAPEDVPRVIDELRAGRVEFKLDKTANIHVPIGKASFQLQQLLENFAALMDAVQRARPAGAKGQYVKKIVLTSTMGPGVKVDITEALALRVA
ncbi:MAG: 50S ribosomal protein L1 [Anaerolineae bacterium]|nr:50S ribosomal protein L1 [Anaerolineae bacterium]NIN97159.1 50S ribosomal protein L1 [Anaerolineae bacterium]NIQ80131.1 50S ribosomal protein L1 [Anaerolineae bacterium]